MLRKFVNTIKCHKIRLNQFGNYAILENKRWSSTHMSVFDRNAKKLQRDRSVQSSNVDTYDYIRSSIAERLVDRIFDMTKEIKQVAEIGCNCGYITRHELPDTIKKFQLCDSSELMLKQAEASVYKGAIEYSFTQMDEEKPTFEANSLDMIVSNLSLHWVNNLPGCFDAIFKSLKPDGIFLASFFGGDTLFELRSALQLAELERKGGLSAHISPFVQVRDIGALLQRAGFTMLTIDTDELTVGYPSMIELMYDLKGMGENNSTYNRPLHLNRDVIMAATAIYDEMYKCEQGVLSTYQLIYLIGWKPAPGQPKPLERGSATASFKDLGNVVK